MSAAPPPPGPPSANAPDLLLVEDHPELRRVLQRLLGARGFHVGSVGDVGAALGELSRDHDVVVVDWRLRGETAAPILVERLRRRDKGGVVVLTAFANDDVRTQAAALGADALVQRHEGADALVEACHAAATIGRLRRAITAGVEVQPTPDELDAALGPDATAVRAGLQPKGERFLLEFTDRLRQRGNLTPRQAEVLGLYIRGFPIPAIARTIGRAVNTVRAHLGLARSRLGADDLHELWRVAALVLDEMGD